MIKNRKNRKGFTLIELLVVIAIIAVLAVVVVLTLNPAELLRQARDSNRLSDFATLKSALSLYATDVSTSTPMYGATGQGGTGDGSFDLFTANSGASTTMTNYNTAGPTWWGFAGGEGAVAINTSRAVNGTGWIPIDFNAVSSGAPLSSLPVDPVNSGQNMYMYAASSTVFKLATKMESSKYTTGGSADVETSDGGNSTSTYEAGTSLNAL